MNLLLYQKPSNTASFLPSLHHYHLAVSLPSLLDALNFDLSFTCRLGPCIRSLLLHFWTETFQCEALQPNFIQRPIQNEPRVWPFALQTKPIPFLFASTCHWFRFNSLTKSLHVVTHILQRGQRMLVSCGEGATVLPSLRT